MMHSLYAPSPCIIKATKKIRQSHAHLLRLFRSHNSMIQVAPVIVHVRSFSSKNREGSFTVNMPSPETKSWQRGAKLVKNTGTTSNKYLEHIRQTHDPALHLKTLEDELKGTMGQALGKQGEKVLNILNQMHEERRKVNALLTTCCSNMNLQDSESNLDVDVDAYHVLVDANANAEEEQIQIPESAKKHIYHHVQNHNRMRKQSVQARWELLVHRQAIGFITQNHKFVNEMFQIPEIMNLPGNTEDWKDYKHSDDAVPKKQQVVVETVTRNFGDQLDWWERIGRWR